MIGQARARAPRAASPISSSRRRLQQRPGLRRRWWWWWWCCCLHGQEYFFTFFCTCGKMNHKFHSHFLAGGAIFCWHFVVKLAVSALKLSIIKGFFVGLNLTILGAQAASPSTHFSRSVQCTESLTFSIPKWGTEAFSSSQNPVNCTALG